MGHISPVMTPSARGRPTRLPQSVSPWYPDSSLDYDYDYGYRPQPRYEPPVFIEEPPELPPPPQRVVELSHELPAVLVLDFPAAAEVWVNGVKGDAKPDREWTLTSPPVKLYEEFTFKVKARWKSGGKTYETERSVTVPNGKRSRVLVVGGTEVEE
jgi:hypothetical protein